MTLRDGEKGKGYRVLDVSLGRAAKIRLEAIGMTNGTTVFIMNKKRNGSMVVKVKIAGAVKDVGAERVAELAEAVLDVLMKSTKD